jgi:hypothetical protein
MPLSETVIRQAKPGTKAIKMFDGRGLYLLLSPNGSRGWRFKYRVDGREKLLSFGIYPDVPFKLARDRREAARQLLAAGAYKRPGYDCRSLSQAHWSMRRILHQADRFPRPTIARCTSCCGVFHRA